MDEDKELVTRVLMGIPEAFDELVNKYSRPLGFFLARDMGLPPEGKDEVLQTVFKNLWENDYHRLRLWAGRGSLHGFLKTVARNLAHDWRTARGTVGNPSNGDSPANEWQPWPAGEGVVTPEAETVLADLRRILTQGIDMLTTRCQQTLKLRFFEDWKNPEIAARLGMTPGNVAATVTQCLRKLRDVLAENSGILAWPVGGL